MLRSFREIELFAAVYEHRSFTAAAQMKNVTQPGVSRHIRQLENTLGVQLFERNTNRVVPTPAGQIFYRQCVDLLRGRDEAVRSVAPFQPGLHGAVVAGVMRSMTGNLLPRALLRFSELHPNVTLRAVEGYSRELVGQVSSGVLDFAVAVALADTKELPARPFLRIGEALVARAGHRLLGAGKTDLRSIKDLQLIIPGPENMRREHVLSYFRAAGIQTSRTMEIDTVAGTLGVIKESDWVSVLPLISIPEADGSGLFVQPLVDPLLTLDLVVVEQAGRQLSVASEEFLRVLSAEADSLDQHYRPAIRRRRAKAEQRRNPRASRLS